VRLLPESARTRRRLLVLGCLLGFVAAAVAAGVFLGRDKRVRETRGTVSVAVGTTEPKSMPLSARDKRAINEVLSAFVRTAVARRDVGSSYDLATPALRQGISRRKWASGNIPVFEFATDMRRVEVFHYSLTERNDVLGEVIVLPKKSAKGVGPIGFSAEVKATGKGSKRRWLVDSFFPQHMYPPQTSEGEATAKSKAATAGKATQRARTPPVVTPPPGQSGRLSTKWLLVPLGFFSLLILVPVGIGLRDWVMTMRAERRHGRRRELPELPRRDA
jgi:hypothetical protein